MSVALAHTAFRAPARRYADRSAPLALAARRSGREGARVKNRAPASVQITAEQLLREAADFQEKAAPKPKQRVEDVEELDEYKSRKRTTYEEDIRKTRANISAWCKYANWEASQQEFPR